MSKDGMFYSPVEESKKVCEQGEFVIAAAGLMHGHIYGMCSNLVAAGAGLKWAWDEDQGRLNRFMEKYPGVQRAESLEQILEDDEVHMVASADIPSLRGPIGLKAMEAGKHYFADKAPFTTREQLEAAREMVRKTGLVWAVCYSERLQNEAAILAGQMIDEGRIGRVVQVMGMGPHRLNKANRPPYFFEKDQYGGILCDIGSHQIEQFLSFTGAKSAEVVHAAVHNYANPDKPGLDDFGDARLVADNGATCYFRVDWFTPDGLRTWGDGRTFVLGTEGYIELRKYIDITCDSGGNQLLLVDHEGEHRINASGTTGFPFFPQLIRDCLDGTEHAMSQEHAFLAADLSLRAQEIADA
jgi:predicted dehydrogenase